MEIDQLLLYTNIKIELKKLIVILAFNALFVGSISGYSSSPSISMTRSFSDSICTPGEEIIITISLKFDDLSYNARGIYLADNIPNILASSVKTLSVKLDMTDITNSVVIERDTLNSIYENTTIFRWILETPPWFSERLPVHPFEEVIVMYSITVPQSAEERTIYNFPNASWITVVNPFYDPSYEFGFEDFPNPELVVNLPSHIESKDKHDQIGFALFQNYPNPFNPSTVIGFNLNEEGVVKLIIYNNRGEIVTKLLDKKLYAGYHEIIFNSKSIKNNDFVNSGVYYYQLHVATKSGKFKETKKMVLLK